jgi:hypothetical protein
MSETDFVTLHWKLEILTEFGLPDIGYPIPTLMLKRLMTLPEIDFGDMLYWIQEYSAQSRQYWRDYEPAMLRLSELLAPEETPEVITAEGDDWFLLVAPIDLTNEIVTIQRDGCLVAAMQDYGNGRLVASVYRPLDSKSARYLLSLSIKPTQDGRVCLKPNNWEYALDSSAGMGNAYAADRGEAYLSYWQFGLGIGNDDSTVDEWHSQRGLEPILSKYAAIQIGLNYKKSVE